MATTESIRTAEALEGAIARDKELSKRERRENYVTHVGASLDLGLPGQETDNPNGGRRGRRGKKTADQGNPATDTKTPPGSGGGNDHQQQEQQQNKPMGK